MSNGKNDEKKEEKLESSAKAQQGDNQEQKSADKKPADTVPKSEYDELKERVLRLAAEFDNYKKRSTSDLENAKNVGKAEILKRIMPVIDEFELAMISSSGSSDENLSKGIKMVYANLMDSLKAEGLREVEAKGKYDPYTNEIMMARDSPKDDPGTVLEVLKKGYKINGILVRPAAVIIAKEPQNDANNGAVAHGKENNGEGKENKEGNNDKKEDK